MSTKPGTVHSFFNSGGNESMIGGIVQFVLGVGWVVYNVGYVGGNTGVTYGRRVAKTRLVSAATGQPIGPGMSILRYFAHIVDSIICYIGWLFPLWDAKRQTLADKMLNTVVLDESPTTPPAPYGPPQQPYGY